MKRMLILSSFAALLQSCYYDNREDLYPAAAACDTSAVTYAGRVFPIIRSNCYSCHGSGSTLGNVNLDGYVNLKNYADNGKLLGAIDHRNGYSPMPQGANKLSDCDISTISIWINNGSPDN